MEGFPLFSPGPREMQRTERPLQPAHSHQTPMNRPAQPNTLQVQQGARQQIQPGLLQIVPGQIQPHMKPHVEPQGLQLSPPTSRPGGLVGQTEGPAVMGANQKLSPRSDLSQQPLRVCGNFYYIRTG